jgi:hypothetical protein
LKARQTPSFIVHVEPLHTYDGVVDHGERSEQKGISPFRDTWIMVAALGGGRFVHVVCHSDCKATKLSDNRQVSFAFFILKIT